MDQEREMEIHGDTDRKGEGQTHRQRRAWEGWRTGKRGDELCTNVCIAGSGSMAIQ